jgi:dolichol kinase
MEKRSALRTDTYRKIPHILIFIGLFILWYIGIQFVLSSSGSTSGMIPENNNMMELYFRILTVPNSIKGVLFSLGWFYYLLFFFFYVFSLIIIFNEYTRKAKSFSFPFNILCDVILCEEEQKGWGTYLYFAVSQLFTSFTCPPMIFFSILGMSSIGDLASSQIGIRYGKHKLPNNKQKSVEGTIAGLITGFIISFFFIGFYWSIILSIIFALTDIFTGKRYNRSDNLLFPVLCSLVYVSIRFIFNLNYDILFLAFIRI